MALLYALQKKQKSIQKIVAEIQDLDYQGLGVAKIQGKTWFIENALPTEKVEAIVTDEKRQYGLATAQKWLQESNQRVEPQCSYYGRCGGCQGQHIPVETQRKAKEKALFSRLSKLQAEPIQLMPMICGEQWGYRRRVRLSLLWNAKNKIIEMGFRQKNSNQLVSIQQCLVAEPAINDLIPKLTALWAQYSVPKQLGHVELVSAENGVAMLLRYRGNLAETDRTLLLEFARINAVNLFLQDDQNLQLVHGEMPYYALDDIHLSFDIRDFIQVNTHLNQQMVETALDWLDLNQNDHVLDLFCGMGNFTLPLAKRVKSAVGIEGVFDMVQKAQANVDFYQADLDQVFLEQPWAKQHFNKILLDPPRSGAAFALNALCELGAESILYVSCNPATLVRDAEILRAFGYRIIKTAMIDMFPHTSHLESVTLFIK